MSRAVELNTDLMRRFRRARSVGPRIAVLIAISSGALVLVGCGSSSPPGSGIGPGDSKGAGGGHAGGASGNAGAPGAFIDGGDFAGTDASSVVIPLDASCGQSTIAAAPRPVNILLVIDESGSMTQKPTGFASDKWSALKTALGSALSAVKNDISFGLELFPYPKDPSSPIAPDCAANCCEMPAVPGLNIPIGSGAITVPKILSALQASSPGGGTPTATALARAADYFKSGAGAALPGDRYVLLATDGGPDCNVDLACVAAQCTTNLDGACTLPTGGNCCDPTYGGAAAKSRCLDDASTNAAIALLQTEGVKTFVVGIPGSEIYKTSLDGFAEAGGEVNTSGPTKYYAVTTAGGATGLGGVLTSITQNLLTTCVLPLTSTPEDTTKLNVYVDGTFVLRGVNGWHLDEATAPPTVILDGSTCAKVKAEGAESVKIIYGCPPRIR